MVTTNTCPCHPTARGWRRHAQASSQTRLSTHIQYKRTHTNTHPLNYPGHWLTVGGEASCLFPLPGADTEPPGCALKIDQLCVPVLSPLATAYPHKSLFWECHPARVKRGERLIGRSSVLHRAVRPVSVSGSIIVIYAQPSVTRESRRHTQGVRESGWCRVPVLHH